MGGLTYRPRSCHLTLLVTLLRTGFASYGAPQAEVAAPEIAGEVVHPAPYVAQAAPADAAAPVAGAAFRPEAAAQPVVPLPTSTVTFTTTPPLLLPVQVSPNLEPGLVGELFDFKSKTSTVAVIDRTVHHWGDVYSELAMKWTGLLFIQQPGVYHFQITCMGAAELRIDGSILIKEDTLLTQRASIPSNPVTLPAGHHAILIGYTELEGQAGFAINYIGPDTQNMLKLIPAHALMHEKGPCDLRSILGADNIACGDKDRPRLALSSGESCEVITENGDIFAFDEPFNNLFKHAVPPEPPGTAPGKRIAVIIWANEQDHVPRMVREKNPGMRDIVPLKVDWETWGNCVPGSLGRRERAGR